MDEQNLPKKEGDQVPGNTLSLVELVKEASLLLVESIAEASWAKEMVSQGLGSIQISEESGQKQQVAPLESRLGLP